MLIGPADSVQMMPGWDTAYVAGPFGDGSWSQELPLPAATFVENDSFYFPLRFVAEAMGVDYAQDGDMVTLRWEGHETQFFVGSRRFLVDGVEGEASGVRHGFREGLPELPVDENFTPVERAGVVFLPLDFLPAELRASYNSFGARPQPPEVLSFQNDMLFHAPDPDKVHGITMYACRDKALVNGEVVQMPAAPFPGNELLYVPLSLPGRRTGGAISPRNQAVICPWSETARCSSPPISCPTTSACPLRPARPP